MNSHNAPKSSMREFRSHNKRIDYYPTPEATDAIERLRLLHPTAPTRALLDMLVLAGIRKYI